MFAQEYSQVVLSIKANNSVFPLFFLIKVGIPHECYLFIFPPFYEQNQKEWFLLKILMFHLSKKFLKISEL